MGTRVMTDFSEQSSLHKKRSDCNEKANSSFNSDDSGGGIRFKFQDVDVEGPPTKNSGGVTKSNGGAVDVQGVASKSIGFCSLFAENLLSHPCIVLRRQCQVHHSGAWHHLTPLSLFQVAINIQRTQGGLVLWKGLGGVYVVKILSILSESVLSEVTGFPKDISRRSSLKKYGGHLLLKSAVFALTTPFYSASLIETVQSDIASERPGLLDVVCEGLARLGSWGPPPHPRQLPLWALAPATVVLRLAHYCVSSIAAYTVTSAWQLEQQERQQSRGDSSPHSSASESQFLELLAGFTGSLLADVITYPLETIVHRLYVQGTRTIIDNTDSGLGVEPIITGYQGVVDCACSILAEEGLPGLYRGFGALVLQYGLHAAILKLAMFLFDQLSREIARRRQADKDKDKAKASGEPRLRLQAGDSL